LMTSRAGIEYIDTKSGHWDANHWVRGGCVYGVMPANGLIYAPPSPCACYMETKLSGFNALAPMSTSPRPFRELSASERLEKGPAYNAEIVSAGNNGDWATFRHDNARSGKSDLAIPKDANCTWTVKPGGRLSSLVAAEGKVFGAEIDEHTVFALDAGSGETVWTFIAGGRVDSPPTLFNGRAIFGSADGSVYCLRASDGELIWRFLAAPGDLRMGAFEQIESVWPVHGSVLVRDGAAYFVAGRSMFTDGGMLMYKLDAISGEQITVRPLTDRDPDTGELVHEAHFLTMPVALPDVLSADDNYLYMRSQRFDFDCNPLNTNPMGDEKFRSLFHQKKQALQWIYSANYNNFLSETHQDDDGAHLFSPSGFLDDTWFHRAYWTFGKHFTGGFSGYSQAGKFMPAGRMLVKDGDTIFGFGRKPQYYKWTTKLEHQLYSTATVSKIGVEEIKDGRDKGLYKPAKGLEYHWAGTLPILVRSMVLADKTLMIAGPPDVLDEEDVLHKLNDPETIAKILAQDAALAGNKGASLWSVDSVSGGMINEIKLDSPPVFDGMALANGNLYIALMNGEVKCYK